MRFVSIALLIFSFSFLALAQSPEKPQLVDRFGKLINDELQGRVMRFEDELAKDGSIGFVILKGPEVGRYFDQRRIIGCGIFTKLPTDKLLFKFSDVQAETSIEFWKVPKGYDSAEFADATPDYKLNLTEPVEMTVSMDSDDFCPRYFELDWYAKFLIANPTLNGRAVIDLRKNNEFLSRVALYRKELVGYGVAANRMRFYHKHFHGEHDEQFWLIPSKK
jgi:hypothetical protein